MRKSMAILLLAWWLVAPAWGAELPREVRDALPAAAEEITEERFSGYLDTAEVPDPDLLIRTSGEQRLSNYLLWQLAYTEIYVTDVLWPDFNKDELQKAVDSFGKRERRYGGRLTK